MTPASLQDELGKRRPFDSAEEEAYLNLVRTHAALTGRFDQLFRQYGLSSATYNVLRILRGAGEAGRMCHEIGADMVARVPDVTRLVDRLEKAGLAARRRCDKDRRVIHVVITQQGLTRLAEIDPALAALHRDTLGHLSGAELVALSLLLFKARHPTPAAP